MIITSTVAISSMKMTANIRSVAISDSKYPFFVYSSCHPQTNDKDIYFLIKNLCKCNRKIQVKTIFYSWYLYIGIIAYLQIIQNNPVSSLCYSSPVQAPKHDNKTDVLKFVISFRIFHFNPAAKVPISHCFTCTTIVAGILGHPAKG